MQLYLSNQFNKLWDLFSKKLQLKTLSINYTISIYYDFKQNPNLIDNSKKKKLI